jgi:uncharacterized BrkB/YihY/UPF0761 family membrane protein
MSSVSDSKQSGSDQAEPHKGLRERRAELAARAETAKRTAEQQAETLRRRHATVRWVFNAYEHDRRHAGALLAGGLAYRFFLWLLPMALVVASFVGLIADLSSLSPEEVAKKTGLAASLTATIARAGAQAGRGAFPLLLIGLWALLWAGKSVVKSLRLVSAVAWQIRPGSLTHGIRASLAFTGVAAGLMSSTVFLRPLYRGPFVTDLLVWVVTAAASIPVFAWLFERLPHPEGLRWTALLPGAVLVGVGLQALRVATSVYFVGRLERLNDLYGALGITIVTMIWLFLAGRFIVAALALNATRYRAEQESPAPGV